MATIPIITIDFSDQAEEVKAPSNVVGLPPLTMAMQKLRHLRRCLARCEESIANDDPNSASIAERVRAGCSIEMLPEWQAQLQYAEARIAFLQAGDALTYRGQVYRAHLSAAGAN